MQSPRRENHSTNLRTTAAASFSAPAPAVLSPKRLCLTQSTTTALPSPASPSRRAEGLNRSRRAQSVFVEAIPSPPGNSYSNWFADQQSQREEESWLRADTVEPRARGRSQTVGQAVAPVDRVRVESAAEKEKRAEIEFEQLLDTMSLTDTVRRQMLTITPALKAQMLAAASFTPATALLPPPSPTKSIGSSWNFSPKKRSVRSKSHSRGESLKDNLFDTAPRTLFGNGNESKRPSLFRGDSQEEKKPAKGSVFSSSLHKTKSSASLRTLNNRSPTYEADEDPLSVSPRKPLHNRNGSASISFLKSLIPKKSSSSLSSDYARQEGVDEDHHDAALQANKFRSTSNADLRVAEVGQLRLRLRGRKTAWVVEFLKHGGYLGMLDRLKEVLELEWREEQKDDQLLHELLRCFEALSLTSCGKVAMAAQSVTPFIQLAALLFSDRRPGDLSTREIILVLLGRILEIQPEKVTLPLTKAIWSQKISTDGSSRTEEAPIGRYVRKSKFVDGDEGFAREKEEKRTQAHELLRALLLGPPSEKEEAEHGFMKDVRRPRIFKLWVTEMSSITRDFYWIFCHPNNVYNSIDTLDQVAIESPQVPSGMTGGVEYEAMHYCTEHLRLINALAESCPTPEQAFAFHLALFQSGLENEIYVLRKASATYYPVLHLHLARYVSLARSARFNLGANLLKYVERTSLSRAELEIMESQARRDAAEAKAREVAGRRGEKKYLDVQF